MTDEDFEDVPVPTKHTIEVIVDRLVMKPDIRKRLTDSVETTLRLSTGIVTALVAPPGNSGQTRELTFSEAFACVYCGLSFEELAPRLFSFNSPYGACPGCSGLGEKIEIDPWKVIPDRSKSIAGGAIVPWSKSTGGRFPSMNPYYLQQLERVLRKHRVKTSTPIEKLSGEVLDVILYGTDSEQNFAYESRAGSVWEYRSTFEGVVNNLQRRYAETSSEYVKEDIEKYMSASTCPQCKGARLKPEALAVTVGAGPAIGGRVASGAGLRERLDVLTGVGRVAADVVVQPGDDVVAQQRDVGGLVGAALVAVVEVHERQRRLRVELAQQVGVANRLVDREQVVGEAARHEQRGGRRRGVDLVAGSYTHLTLPTIYPVRMADVAEALQTQPRPGAPRRSGPVDVLRSRHPLHGVSRTPV